MEALPRKLSFDAAAGLVAVVAAAVLVAGVVEIDFAAVAGVVAPVELVSMVESTEDRSVVGFAR